MELVPKTSRISNADFRTEKMGEYTIVAKQWGLQEIPQELLEKQNAKVIVLCRNSLTTLPPEIGGLTKLTVLKLDQNRIRVLPSQVGNLLALTELSLTDNLLNNLPLQLGGITGLKKLVLNGNPLMGQLPGSDKKLWEVYHGTKAGPCPPTEMECRLKPEGSSGTIKMRTKFVMTILKRAHTQHRDIWSSRGLSIGGGQIRALQEAEETLSARVRPGGEPGSIIPAGSSTSRANNVSIRMAAEEPPSGTPAKPATLSFDQDERRARAQQNRGRFLKGCCLIGGVAIGVAAVVRAFVYDHKREGFTAKAKKQEEQTMKSWGSPGTFVF
ncbi:hypothetical protein BSKO_02791 [Bryopsis sp. KO-2023]|nr:hypothetical protein BSKO_02791 [Bryopsis sp. KO-2023]